MYREEGIICTVGTDVGTSNGVVRVIVPLMQIGRARLDLLEICEDVSRCAGECACGWNGIP